MNDSEFEKHLQRQPLRPIPHEWRTEILQQATSADSRRLTHDRRPSFLSALLWPHPKAWAGLAAVWVLIYALRFASQDNLPKMAQASPSSPQEMVVKLKEQQQILAELIASSSSQTHDMDRPKPFIPQPHSERRTASSMA